MHMYDVCLCMCKSTCICIYGTFAYLYGTFAYGYSDIDDALSASSISVLVLLGGEETTIKIAQCLKVRPGGWGGGWGFGELGWGWCEGGDDDVFYLLFQKQNRSRAPYIP
jgi:hypothetical protein